ncbi:putative tRNA pseudouridine synthase Pus10 [Diaphorina citri]|uniref:tRNA pseudouridine(55) synthase n=1 Tax=Diaphorina citri TaxID=121845 RepID=A0A3Q0J5W6_DIACI|nr:putative tRNA pseudouridine synthase Pus10 [Diaphorina citri]
MAPTIAKTVKRMLKFNSELTINVKLTYSNDELECFKLLELCPDVFGQRNTKKFRGFLFSKKSVDEALNNKKNVKLRNFYINPPSIPNHELLCSEVDIKQNQIYCAGRYNKYSRSLPQSPWIKNNQRRFNSSVQELIAKDVLNLFKADDYLFSSSGREDVDVRMLGTGRPFSIELINPKCTKITQKQIDALMDKINNENGEKIRVQDMTTVSKDHLKLSARYDNCFQGSLEIIALMDKINKENGEKIRVQDMTTVSKDHLKLLKDGEDSKTKTYEALCVSKNPLTKEHLLNISKCTPLVVNQKTPIRVLHRRANLVRLKTIHSMDATIIPHSRNDNQTFFCLKLVTQAGTYVKEFVNGDFGRTLPNLGTLLNDPDIDILALDVLNIDLDWPPKKKAYTFVTRN